MGEVELFIDDGGVLRILQHHDLSVLVRRWLPKGFERHDATSWRNCSCGHQTTPDAKFNRVLMFCLLLCLGVTVISIFTYEHLLKPSFQLTYDSLTRQPTFNSMWLLGEHPTGQNGIVLLAMFATLLAVGVLTRKVTRKREVVRTVSSIVLHV